ncbi:MAG TPA: hypothetical protein VGO65_01200 [Pseudolysinimonas sp.]|nr:hypothetical protein [Pseudolysinimonas sp.]
MPEPTRLRSWAPALLAAAAALAAFVAGSSAQPTDATWSTVNVTNLTGTAATPAAVPTVTCGAGSGSIIGSPTIPIAWTVPAGPTPSRYRIHWAGSAGTGDVFATTSPGSINAAGISVAGTSTVTVFAEYGDWTAPASLQTVSFTTIAIVVVVSWTCTPFP